MSQRLPLIAALACTVVWSTTYAVTVAVLRDTSPAVLSVGRFAVASVVLLPIAWRRPGFARAMRDPWAVLLGLVGVAAYYSLSNIGLQFTSAGSGALAAAMTPVLTTVFAVVLVRERVPPRTILGLVLTTLGIVVVGGASAGAGAGAGGGLLLCVGGIAAYALYVVLLRRRPPVVDAIVLGTATTVWGTVLMLPWLGVESVLGTARVPTEPAAIVGILYEALIVTAPTMILFNYAAERLPAAVSGITIGAIPALGYAIALAFGESWDAVKAAGGAVALVGIAVATVAPRPRRGSPLALGAVEAEGE